LLEAFTNNSRFSRSREGGFFYAKTEDCVDGLWYWNEHEGKRRKVDPVLASIIGAAYCTGVASPVNICDGKNEVSLLAQGKDFMLAQPASNRPKVLYGVEEVTDFCRQNPLSDVRVCVLKGDKLKAFGALIAGMVTGGHRVTMCRPDFATERTEELPFDSSSHDDLRGSAFARMASVVSTETPVLNMTKKAIWEDPFHDRLLCPMRLYEPEDVVVLGVEDAQRLYPEQPFSVLSASDFVPVRMPGKNLRSIWPSAPDCDVRVMSLTSWHADARSFLGVLQYLAKDGIFCSKKPFPYSLDKTVPLFHYDRAYRVNLAWLKERLDESEKAV